jgi:selenium metabolism protein YedF
MACGRIFMKPIDCSGLACPGPVIQVKKAMEELSPGDTLEVKVDSDASLENVRRFVESRGGGVRAGKDGESGFLITIVMPEDTETRGHGDAEESSGRRASFDQAQDRQGTGREGPGTRDSGPGTRDSGPGTQSPPVVFIAGDAIGTGDDKLGRILMEGFVNTLLEQETAPDKILLMNGGVRLAAKGSAVLDTLGKLVDRGCEILVCGTCLDYFELKKKLAMGTVSNMYDIQRAMLTASKVVRP